MAEGADDEIIREVEITFNPRPEVLAELGITLEEFEEALLNALEDREDQAEDAGGDESETPDLEDMPLEIGGVVYKLEDLADVGNKEENS